MSFIVTDANGLRNGGDCLTMHDNAKEVANSQHWIYEYLRIDHKVTV